MDSQQTIGIFHQSTHTDYILKDYNVDGSEWERLDELHHGFEQYIGGLTFAPISPSPTHILDIGAGSGAWAIQAALMYPNAEVTAADISALPQRWFPPNVKYQHCDIRQPLPFEVDTFDVVHMRSLLYHLPLCDIPTIIERVSSILAPGGWLIVEDYGKHVGHEMSRGPAQSTVNAKFMDMMKEKGLDVLIGEHLGNIIQSSAKFTEINIKKVELELSYGRSTHGDTDTGYMAFSRALLRTLERIGSQMTLGEAYRGAGITEDLQEKWLEERADPTFRTWHDVWFTWSKKRFIV